MAAPSLDALRSAASDFRAYATLLAVAGALLVVSGLLDGATLTVSSLTAFDLLVILVGNAVFLAGVAGVLYHERFDGVELPVWILGLLLVGVLAFVGSVALQVAS